MSYTTLWAYTWDLSYGSTADNIAALRHDIGLDAISVATAYHTYEMLCAHRPGGKFVRASEAAVYFRPRPDLYADTPIKPYVSPSLGDSDPLAEIGDACQANGLGLTSWTVCLHNSQIGTAHPGHAQANAFGDPMPHAPCPASPAVRAYMQALVKDLTGNYPITAVELETLNYSGYAQGHYHEKIGLPIGPVENFLFSLCFCPHCRARAQDAGIDVDAVQTSVRTDINRFCAEGAPSTQALADYVGADEAIGAFVRMRAETVESLTRLVKEASPVPVYYLLMGNYYGSGMDYAAIAKIVDRVEVLAYSADSDQVRQTIRGVSDSGIDAGQIHAGFGAYHPAAPDEQTLVANTRAAAAEGVSGFSYYNYGIMPKRNLQWVKAAVAQAKGV